MKKYILDIYYTQSFKSDSTLTLRKTRGNLNTEGHNA